MDLPKAYLEKMERLLSPEEYQAYLKSFDEPLKKGIRANGLKINREDLREQIGFDSEPVRFSDAGLYIDQEIRPGKQPEYYSGLYYPQEPSAMSSAEVLEIHDGESVLDLCASPGGKSTQLSAKLGDTGFLVLNEVVKGRIKALEQNTERMGTTNTVIVNERPDRLVKNFENCFDKILVDAPCSGEGMFRKDEDVIAEWTPERSEKLQKLQRDILREADKLLKPGGELVYSTCTFDPLENEEQVLWLRDELGYEILPAELEGVSSTGRPEYVGGDEEVKKTIRIWPQDGLGEGHFVARLKKHGEDRRWNRNSTGNKYLKKPSKEDMKLFKEFINEYEVPIDKDRVFQYKDALYQLPKNLYPRDLIGLSVVRPGLHLGTLKKDRFEPAQALAMSLKKEEFNNTYELNEDELWHYLKGEEIPPIEAPRKGWTLMCYEGYPVGFGKFAGTIKNKYPKGLRIHKK